MRRPASGMPTSSSSVVARSRAAVLDTGSCARICSAMCQPTLYTGVREVIGSWKIIAMSLPRRDRRSLSRIATRSWPRKRASPSTTQFGSRMSFRMLIIETLLPDPDSPTIARSSPACRVNDSPSTACTVPWRERNETRRPSTSSRGSGISHPGLEDGVEQVDDGVGQDDEERRVEDATHDHRKVDVLERVVGQLADPREAEDDLGEQCRPAHQRPEVEPEQRHDRDEGAPQGMLDQDPPLGEPLGPRSADVVLVERAEQLPTEHTGVDAGVEDGEGEPGEEQPEGPLQRVLGQGHVAERGHP